MLIMLDCSPSKIEEYSKHQKTLSTPLSKTGLKPITHWVCSYDSSDKMINQLFRLNQSLLIKSQ